MSYDFNQVILMGHLGQMPSHTVTSEKKDFATFNLAINKSWKEDDKVRTRTDWFAVILNGKLAKFAGETLSKGSKVLVKGELRTNKWLDEKGTLHSTIQVLANELHPLDKSALKEKSA